MNGERRSFTITKLRHDDGVWRARVTVDGDGVDVDTQFGSWRITPKHEGGPYREVPCTGAIAQELSRQVRALENARKPKKVAVTNGQAAVLRKIENEESASSELEAQAGAPQDSTTPERFVVLG